MENVLKECPLVELPLCYARSTESFCIALVCPSHVALKALGKSLGLGEDVSTLCANKQIIAEVSKQCLPVLTLTSPNPNPNPKPDPNQVSKQCLPVLTLTSPNPNPKPDPNQVSKQCLAVCKPKLVSFEIPKKIGLVAETWTPDNDLLTAAMKLKRIPIVAKHKAELDALYS